MDTTSRKNNLLDMYKEGLLFTDIFNAFYKRQSDFTNKYSAQLRMIQGIKPSSDRWHTAAACLNLYCVDSIWNDNQDTGLVEVVT